nr:putative DNA-directed RNA polymerases III, 39 kDa polypeptide [Cryptomonas curvata]
MPTFISNHFLDLSFEKASIIAACCENNRYVYEISNVIFPCYLNSVSFNNVVRSLILSKIIDEIKNQKDKQFFEKIFCNFISEKFRLSNDYYITNQEVLKENKNFYLNENNTDFFSKEKEISYMEREFYLYVSKSKHQGCSRFDLNAFTNDSKLVSPISKRLFSKFFLLHLKKKNIIKRFNWPCIVLVKKKKYITKIKSEIKFTEFRIKNSKYICNFFENCFHSVESPPCMNCPVIIECHPQGSINPFDCRFMKNWNCIKG